MAMFSARRRLFDIHGEFLISCTKSCGIERIAFWVPASLIYLCTYLLITHHSSTTLFIKSELHSVAISSFTVI